MARTQTIVLGGGCFWCLDAAYRLVKGVDEVISGYSGGTTPNPTMEEVYTGATGHAEVVKLEFNPAIITIEDVLDVFWALHDPTTLNRQGNDVGTEYRSVIFYNGDQQKTIVEKSLKEAQKLWNDPIVTEVKPLVVFYPADEDQQDFFNKYPERAYCQIIINPKLQKLRQKYVKLLKI